MKTPAVREILEENRLLRQRLEEAEDALRAIREGEVDAIVVSGSKGERVFSLSDSESVYRLIVETMKEAALTVTFEGRILFCNAQFCELIRSPRQQIVGRQLDEFVRPDQRKIISNLIANSKQESNKGRLLFQSPAGIPVAAHISVNMLHQADDLSICIVATDLTELESSTEMLRQLRIQQEALAQTEQRYRDLVELSPEAIVVQSDGKFVYINPAGVRLLGAEREEDIIGMDVLERVAPDQRAEALQRVDRMLREGATIIQMETQMLRLDGAAVDVDVTANRITHQGRPAVQAILRDIRARKSSQRERDRLLESLDRQRTFLQSVLDQMPAGIVIAEAASGQIIMSNEQMARFTGLRGTNEHYSKFDVYDASGRPYPFESRPLTRALQKGEVVVDEEMRFLRPDGGWVLTMGSAAPVHDKNGNVVAAVVVHLDIAERKQMEQVLVRAQQELEVKVRERTAELTQAVKKLQAEIPLRIITEERLREQTQKLRALASEVTLAEQRERRRLAEMIHDHLQQFLVGAKFRIGALKLDPEKNIAQGLNEVDEMIDQSIEVARSLTGELSPPLLHEGGLVSALVWLVRWMKEKHGLRVELTVLEKVTAEPEDTRVLLFQAVRELLFNVVKHAHTGSAAVELGNVDNQICITVSDRGVGFDPDLANEDRTPSGCFGLFSIRERLHLLGGNMKIESAVGRGSRFTLLAPLQSVKRAPQVPKDRVRVVLVDDHVTVRQGLVRLLDAEPDIQVVGEASDGKSGLELVRRLQPHIVVMDVKMPGMNGVEATRIIKSEFPQINVIGLSMFVEGEHADAIRRAGASAYLPKAGASENLISAIRACCPMARSETSAG